MSEPPNTPHIFVPAPTTDKRGVFAANACPRCGVPEGEACWFRVKTFALAHKERWQKFSLLPVREFRVPRSHVSKQTKQVLVHKKAQWAKRSHWLCSSVHCSCERHAIRLPAKM